MAKEELAEKASKSFKSNAEVENFYRFIHENGLRREAKMVLDAIRNTIKPKRKTRKKRTKKS